MNQHNAKDNEEANVDKAIRSPLHSAGFITSETQHVCRFGVHGAGALSTLLITESLSVNNLSS